tara:strand:+ start:101 stop:475 length:375 start_codon:yes stop_codon:yes gene_type:complete
VKQVRVVSKRDAELAQRVKEYMAGYKFCLFVSVHVEPTRHPGLIVVVGIEERVRAEGPLEWVVKEIVQTKLEEEGAGEHFDVIARAYRGVAGAATQEPEVLERSSVPGLHVHEDDPVGVRPDEE